MQTRTTQSALPGNAPKQHADDFSFTVESTTGAVAVGGWG